MAGRIVAEAVISEETDDTPRVAVLTLFDTGRMGVRFEDSASGDTWQVDFEPKRAQLFAEAMLTGVKALRAQGV